VGRAARAGVTLGRGPGRGTCPGMTGRGVSLAVGERPHTQVMPGRVPRPALCCPWRITPIPTAGPVRRRSCGGGHESSQRDPAEARSERLARAGRTVVGSLGCHLPLIPEPARCGPLRHTTDPLARPTTSDRCRRCTDHLGPTTSDRRHRTDDIGTMMSRPEPTGVSVRLRRDDGRGSRLGGRGHRRRLGRCGRLW
jgi:hypothetical protein